jgi:tripartite-type tricarboxylate transporter receptor subunit TctC
LAELSGGGVDLTARILAKGVSELLRQSIIVDNMPGASGMLANNYVAKQPPDGYYLLVTSDVQLISPYFIKDPGFDFVRDMDAVSIYVRDRIILGTPYEAPWANFEEMVAQARKSPGKLNHSTGGAGDIFVLYMAAITQKYGVEVTNVAYKTTGEKSQAVATNQIQLNFFNQVGLAPLVAAKKARPLAVTGDERLAAFPTTPTFNELNVIGPKDNSHFVLVRTGTPAATIARLYAAISKTVSSPDTKAQLAKLGGLTAVDVPPDTARAYLREVIQTYTAIAKKAGIEPQ